MRCYRADRVLEVGGLSLGDEARVIAVVPAGPEAAALAAKAAAQGADLIEVRLDRAAGIDVGGVADVLGAVAEAAPLPRIATARLPGQRGAFRGTETERLALLAEAARHAHLVDVEINARAIRDDVRAACEAGGARLLVSFHDTVQTPSLEAMQGLAEEAVERVGAAVFKMCPVATDLFDMARLLGFTQWFRDRFASAQVVGMSLGAVGAPSRLIGPAFGSCMTYGYVEGGAPAVQGQYSIAELRNAWDVEANKEKDRESARERLADLLGAAGAEASYQLRG